MDIKALHVYLDLTKDLHFGKTAEAHNMSPSTLSRMVKRLELEAGVDLLHRDNRNVTLTADGERFRDFARITIDHWQQFQRSTVVESKIVAGAVSLYCSVTASHSLLANLLEQLRERYSGVEIQLHTGDQALSISRLKEGYEDLAIAARPDKLDERIAFKPLSESELVLIAPKQAGVVSVYVQSMVRENCWDWSRLPWIVAEKGLLRRRLNDWFKTMRVKPNIYAQVTGHEAIVSMVGLGFGVGLVPKLVITNSPAFDSIEILDMIKVSPFPSFEIGLCVLKRRLKEPLVEAVWSSAN